MKLEIKHLAPYLPYELNGVGEFLKDTILIVEGIKRNRIIGFTKDGNNVPIGCMLNEFIPILRPMGDIKYYLDFLKKYYVNFSDTEGLLVKRRNECYTRINELDFFYKNHFDVFGLIEKGLALDINNHIKV